MQSAVGDCRATISLLQICTHEPLTLCVLVLPARFKQLFKGLLSQRRVNAMLRSHSFPRLTVLKVGTDMSASSSDIGFDLGGILVYASTSL